MKDKPETQALEDRISDLEDNAQDMTGAEMFTRFRTIYRTALESQGGDVHGVEIIISKRDPDTNKLERLTVMDEENGELVLLQDTTKKDRLIAMMKEGLIYAKGELEAEENGFVKDDMPESDCIGMDNINEALKACAKMEGENK